MFHFCDWRLWHNIIHLYCDNNIFNGCLTWCELCPRSHSQGNEQRSTPIVDELGSPRRTVPQTCPSTWLATASHQDWPLCHLRSVSLAWSRNLPGMFRVFNKSSVFWWKFRNPFRNFVAPCLASLDTVKVRVRVRIWALVRVFGFTLRPGWAWVWVSSRFGL